MFSVFICQSSMVIVKRMVDILSINPQKTAISIKSTLPFSWNIQGSISLLSWSIGVTVKLNKIPGAPYEVAASGKPLRCIPAE